MPTDMSPDLDRTMQLLFLVTLLLYLAPSVLGGFAPAGRVWLQRAAAVTLAAGVVLALIASARWFAR